MQPASSPATSGSAPLSPSSASPTPAGPAQSTSPPPRDSVHFSDEVHGETSYDHEGGTALAMALSQNRRSEAGQAGSTPSGPHASSDPSKETHQAQGGDTKTSSPSGPAHEGTHDPHTKNSTGTSSHTQGAAEAQKLAKAQAQRKHDQELLARAIAAEARGESYQAQVGVASVILNKARASGQSISSLVHSSFLSSSTDGNRGFYRMPTSHIPNFQQFNQAAADALDGKAPFGKEYTHFTDDSIKSTPWTSPHNVITIDHMRFYKERG